jgi:SAM-dependent methyltransferase
LAAEITNLFVHQTAAERYAAARPYFHPLVVDNITSFTGAHQFARALDVACGTGQSSRALAAVADRVDAVDISPATIAHAAPHPRVHFHVSPAEQLPFAKDTFDIATVGLAFHWFDQAAFLTEAARVLKPASWLVIYSSWFDGEMAENADFRRWACDVYPKRFPTPKRRSVGVTQELIEPHGLTLAGEQRFSHDEVMTPTQLTGYLLTQSNVIAAVEEGAVPLADAADWILGGAGPLFRGPTGTMKFGGIIWYVRR